MAGEEHREIPVVLVACIAEARVPMPSEMAALTERIRREAFPGVPPLRGWRGAWRIACAAVRGASDLKGAAMGEATVILTYQVPRAAETWLGTEVHATASEARSRVHAMHAAGAEVGIIGPDGDALDCDGLLALAECEQQMRIAAGAGTDD